MTNVFVLGRMGDVGFDAVLAVLRDWSAVGLLHPSVWVDVEPGSAGGSVRKVVSAKPSEPCGAPSSYQRTVAPERFASACAILASRWHSSPRCHWRTRSRRRDAFVGTRLGRPRYAAQSDDAK